jgi:hypothetical protein
LLKSLHSLKNGYIFVPTNKLKNKTMNLIELEKFEQDLYLEEKEEFLSDKCSDCMSYLNEETEECDNNFCIGKIPEEYR